MKILIWILCMLANAIITTVFQLNGIYLGALPRVILFIASAGLARSTCNDYDEYKNEKNNGIDE